MKGEMVDAAVGKTLADLHGKGRAVVMLLFGRDADVDESGHCVVVSVLSVWLVRC